MLAVACGYVAFGLAAFQSPSLDSDARVPDSFTTRATDRLMTAPADARTWCGLAYMDQIGSGRLSGSGISHLSRCYEASPLSPDLSVWRARLALENWGALPPHLRLRVREDAHALWTRPTRRRELLTALEQASDPAGALAGRLLTAELWASYRRRVAARAS